MIGLRDLDVKETFDTFYEAVILILETKIPFKNTMIEWKKLRMKEERRKKKLIKLIKRKLLKSFLL